MTTRSTPASSIIGSARSMVNGSGNCGLVPGSQGQSGEFAFPEMHLGVDDRALACGLRPRLLRACGQRCAGDQRRTDEFASCQDDGSSLMAPLFGGVSSLEDCN